MAPFLYGETPMLPYPHMDPVIVHLYGPLAIRWYGLMYLAGLLLAWLFLARRARRGYGGFSVAEVPDILFWGAAGMIVGGRLGYMLLYDFAGLRAAPASLFAIWQGGMSFHGGLLGVLLALWLYARRTGRSLLTLTDFVAPAVPLGLAAGRLGNFVNGELWGRVTDLPWAMVFPGTDGLPRHPSQLYEFFLEGVLLFVLLWLVSRRERQRGVVSGLFLAGYGLLRFLAEFFREPDFQKGFVAFGWMTEGQCLSLPMLAAGLCLLVWACRQSLFPAAK